jgi:hypothetical protein
MARLLVMLAVLGSAAPALAEVGPPVEIAQRARGAGKVVVARVQDVTAQFQTNRFGDQLIVSQAVLEVLETWKGAPQSIVRVSVEGGTVGDLTLRVSDLPSLAEGDRAVFFLDDAAGGGHTPHGRGKGILKLDNANRVQDGTLSLADLREQVRGAVNQGRGGR